MTFYVLDDDGDPLPVEDVLAWAAWFDRFDRRVRQSTVLVGEVPVLVSTVFLGIDHCHDAAGPPVLWETMIFGGAHDGEAWRYTSRADALVGHERAVRLAAGTWRLIEP